MTDSNSQPPHVAVIGGGFCGLAAAYEIARAGLRVTVLEADSDIGGLAGSFQVNGVRLEKFYHHWFTNDREITALVDDLGTRDQVVFRPTSTGMYFANGFFKLSTPTDLLRFTPLSFIDRIRLGILTLRARRVRDWRQLETLTAAEWLQQMGGRNVYKVIWEPLLRGKFGDYDEDISAVWFWNKLKLRGGSRGSKGEEQLAYYRGGFAALADCLADRITAMGGLIMPNAPVEAIVVRDGVAKGVFAGGTEVAADAVIATPALPIVADLLAPHTDAAYVASLRRVKYLANLCMVLELDRSLSSTYWLNVNDPSFPFVAVIEHTNFEPVSSYGGTHLTYLSRYLRETDPLFTMADQDVKAFALPHLKRMFPQFDDRWIKACHVWRARYAQPVVERRYSALIPDERTPITNLHLATMAQIYPEDRGTNYAVREGRRIGRSVAQGLTQ